MSNQNELLDQLKIDRSEPAASGLGIVGTSVVAIVAAVVGIGIGAWWFGSSAPDQPTPVAKPAASPAARPATRTTTESETAEPARVDSSTPAATGAERILNASGYVTARRIATVSSQITGLITEVNVEEGMVVETGQVLARLDDALARVEYDLSVARLASQRAAVANTRANLAEAERVLERARQLRPQNLVSEAELTQATARHEALVADLQRAEAEVAVLSLEIDRQQERLAFHVVTAPFGGVVTVKNAQTGEIVSPGSAGGGFTRTGICTIVDMDSLEIEVDVNEAFIGRVDAGQRVLANLDAYPDWDIDAEVIAIIPTADRSKATVKVRIAINARDARILPDMGVKVAFLKS